MSESLNAMNEESKGELNPLEIESTRGVVSLKNVIR
jgi:hypothetical protein